VRVLLCSGKIAHELHRERARRGRTDVAVIRIEQLYPFPEGELADALARHAQAEEIVWVQEEPGNMGALNFVRPRVQSLIGDRHVTSVKRADSASPATGSHEAHELEQQALWQLAFARLK
jgi:2-oxoglutarate dehydrogenase E1 component